jgi:uncharacterized protein (DUF983 family)
MRPPTVGEIGDKVEEVWCNAPIWVRVPIWLAAIILCAATVMFALIGLTVVLSVG